MNEFTFGDRSLKNLKGVHPDLVAIAHEALEITKADFTVIEGLRSQKRQEELYRQGKTQTLNSRHLTGHAIDVVPYPVSWEWEDFFPVADAFFKASRNWDIPLRWGGNWNINDLRRWRGTSKLANQRYKGSFPDAPHFELPRRHYG